jgi:hypothetical protein
MNWEALGAIGEIVGAAAVFLTLIYLSRQIRAGNRSLRTTLQDSLFHSLQEWNYHIMSDQALANLFHRGAQGMENLEPDDRYRFVHVLYSFFKVWENFYLHYLGGSVTTEVWEGNRNALLIYADQPGLRVYLQERRAFFDPRFVDLLVETRAPSSLKPAAKMLGIEVEAGGDRESV